MFEINHKYIRALYLLTKEISRNIPGLAGSNVIEGSFSEVGIL